MGKCLYINVSLTNDCLVGQFNNGLDFVWNPSWSLDLRSNLMGQFIVAMTEHLPPYSPLKEGFQTGAPFNEGNQTYDVTEWAGGMYPELLYLMSQKLNFTYRYSNPGDVYLSK